MGSETFPNASDPKQKPHPSADLRQLFYLSRAVGELPEAGVRAMLLGARRKNWRLNVTGCLLFSGRHFAQTLEGDATTLRDLSARIAKDPRHTDFRILVDRSIETRAHPDWSMGYLYGMDLADQLEAMLSGPQAPQEQALALMTHIVADSVMGPL